LYRTAPARIVEDQCSCGHAPNDDGVFICADDSGLRVLCGRQCVVTQWHERFAFFLRRGQ
jgi:hypothetical protein